VYPALCTLVRLGSRGHNSFSWVGSRLPRQKNEKRDRGSVKEIGWVGAAVYVLCSSLTLHDTSYSAQQSKPQYSGVTGAHASETARRARAPGRTDMLARAMGITRVDHLPDRDHTVWEVKEPTTVKLPTRLPLLTRRGIATPARTVTLSRRPSKQSWVC